MARSMGDYRKKAIFFAFVFLLFAICCKIYRGPFWQIGHAYLGDVGIVASLYFSVSLLRQRWRPIRKVLVVALFSLLVELLQLTNLPRNLALPDPVIFAIGAKYDPVDYLCYLVGLAIAFSLDRKFVKDHYE
jgi:hypothetical protein